MKIFFTIVFAFTAHINSHAAICWVESVSKIFGGITVIFTPKVSLAVYSSEVNQYSDGKYCRISNNILLCKDGFTSVGLFLDAGKSVTVSNSHHDFCTLRVVEKDSIGIQAHAFLRLPGLPVKEEDEFFPAK
jgi:hypothetical protein